MEVTAVFPRKKLNWSNVIGPPQKAIGKLEVLISQGKLNRKMAKASQFFLIYKLYVLEDASFIILNQVCKTGRRKTQELPRRHLVHPILPGHFSHPVFLGSALSPAQVTPGC